MTSVAELQVCSYKDINEDSMPSTILLQTLGAPQQYDLCSRTSGIFSKDN
jgi:hypothetical protein